MTSNPFRSWRRPLWWLDDFGHRLPRVHKLTLGWLCDYLDSVLVKD